MEVQVTSNAGEIAARLSARAAALRDMRPVLAVIAGEVDRLTGEAISNSRSVDGEPFADLADSTKIGRLRQRKSLWKKASKLKTASKKERTQLNNAGRRKSIYARLAGAGIRSQNADSRKAERAASIAAAIKAAKFRPLINTGRLRASARARVVGNTTVHWSVVDYGEPHIGGAKNGRPPQRNYSVFTIVGGTWQIVPSLATEIVRLITRHINTLDSTGATRTVGK